MYVHSRLILGILRHVACETCQLRVRNLSALIGCIGIVWHILSLNNMCRNTEKHSETQEIRKLELRSRAFRLTSSTPSHERPIVI